MLGFPPLLFALLRAAVRARGELVAANLLPRQPLAVLTRPTWKRPRLRTQDRLFRVPVRPFARDWRRHPVVVRPETVIHGHRGFDVIQPVMSSRELGVILIDRLAPYAGLTDQACHSWG